MLYLMYFDAVKNSFLPMLNNDVNSAQCACNSKQAYIGDFEKLKFLLLDSISNDKITIFTLWTKLFHHRRKALASTQCPGGE